MSMKRLALTTAATLLGATAVAAPAQAAPARSAALPAAQTAAADQSSGVVPLLQHWSQGSGSFRLGPQSRIVVSGGSAVVQTDATTFAHDLSALGLPTLPVVTGVAPQPGDLVLTSGDDSTGEGFSLAVTAKTATIDGDGPVGTFYGEQVVEQLLKTSPTRDSLPVGTDSDAPAQHERGLMLDTARKYWSVASIEQLIRRLAWMRMNTLHWHITDSEFFRLDLPGYQGLAAPRSYTPADVRAVQDYAARYHVAILPELDIPGHATSMTAYNPNLRWDCASMNSIIHSNRPDPGFTVDITKPANVAWLDGLVKEVSGLFDSRVIHLGGDETPDATLQSQCPELMTYAAAHGYTDPEDVFLAYENHLDDVVKGLGKTMEMWGWWPQVTDTNTVIPNKDIRIQAWLGDESYFIDRGYDTVVSNEHSRLYVVPKYAPGTANGNYIPDDKTLYAGYSTPADHVLGMEMAEWGDVAYNMPDAYPLSYLYRPLQVLASTAWGSPQMPSYLDYETLADTIGAPPGVPERIDPAAQPVSGTPFGPAGAAAAFDGDPTTSYAATAGGTAIGLHLRKPTPLAGFRLLPRSSSTADLGSLVGATLQGCTDGPDSGCHTLATVDWTPTMDWQPFAVSDPGSYRWIRLVGSPNLSDVVAELEPLAAPDGVRASVKAPATIAPGAGNTVTVSVSNTTSLPVADGTVSLSATNVLDNTAVPTPGSQTVTVAPGASGKVTFHLDLPADAEPGDYRVTATVDYHRLPDGAATARASGSALSSVPLRDLSEAFDNIGVTSDDNPQPGDFDGAQSSISAQALAAAGVHPGGTLTADGLSYRMADPLVGDVDNALAHGQVVPLSGTASRVGLLVTGTYAPTGGLPGTVTVTYADGTTTQAHVSVPDWSAAMLPAGTVVAVDAGVVNGYGRAQVARHADLYSLSVPTDPSKRLASVTLPSGPAYLGAKSPVIHVFSVTTG